MRRVLLACGHVMCVPWIRAFEGVEVRCDHHTRAVRGFPIVKVLGQDEEAVA